MVALLEFYKKPAVAINANSYPAKRLSLTYRLCLEFLKYDEEAMLHAKDRLTEQIQHRLVEDIAQLLLRKDVPQIIVYIQGKKRLAHYYDKTMREISLRESALNVLGLLLILKTAIMTRIAGCGQVGRQSLMIIPIGGKSVLAAGETFIGILEQLINELRKEYMRNYDRPWLKDVYKSLRELLGQGDFDFSPPREKKSVTRVTVFRGWSGPSSS